MTAICNCIMILLWISMIVVRVIFRKEFSQPIGRREMRNTTGDWAGIFVLSSFVLFFTLLFSIYISLAGWILVLAFMVMIVFIELNVINWRIAYTDTEFIFRDTFRVSSKYAYEEILDIHISTYGQRHYTPMQYRNARVELQMPDKTIRFESRRDDGRFLTVLMRKKNGLK